MRRLIGVNTSIAEQTFSWLRGYAKSFNEMHTERHWFIVLYFVFQFVSDNFGVNAGQFDSIFHWLDTQQAAFLVALAGVVFYLVFIRNSATDSARDGLAKTAADTASQVAKNEAEVEKVNVTTDQLEKELEAMKYQVTTLEAFLQVKRGLNSPNQPIPPQASANGAHA